MMPSPWEVLFENSQYAAWSSVLYAIGVGIIFLEKIRIAADFDVNGCFSWRIFRFDRARLPVFRNCPAVLARVFGLKGSIVSHSIGLVGAGLILASPVHSALFFPGILLTVVVCLLDHARTTYGGDGAQ